MITACHSCEFNGKGQLIEGLIPDSVTDAKAIAARDALLAFFSARCANCRRCSQDDIRIERTPKNHRPELTRQTEAEPSAPCTALPAEVEDTLRRLLATITAMDALDAMLVIHVAKGGTPTTFGKWLNSAFTEARSYGREIGRATAKAKWDAICRKFRPFAALRSWGIGHGGRKAANGDGDDDAPRMSQAELGI